MGENVKPLPVSVLSVPPSSVDQPATSKPPRWLGLVVDGLAVVGGFVVIYEVVHLGLRFLHR